jgi:hypothetical protein
MPVELSLLMQLVSGQKRSLPVGDLPIIVANYMNCHPAIVYLGHKEVIKIVGKHGEKIRVEQLQCLPFAIKNGEYRADHARNRTVSIYYRNPFDKELYVIGIKAASKGGEVWICTFYKSSERNVKNQRERGNMLRAHVHKS